MKILVLGSNGMAGHTISLYFQERGHSVVAHSTRPINFFQNNVVVDAFDKDSFVGLLLSDEYDAVINCIGILNEMAEENPEKAIYLNSYLPHNLVSLMRKRKTKIIHMSTDCVFAGNTGPYFENSYKDGQTFYDRTKALGEIEDGKNLTFRNSIIGPDINKEGIGLFNWFMKQKNPIEGYTKAMWTGVTTLTLAKAMEKAIEVDLVGLYNLVNNISISKYNLLQLFNFYFKNNEIEVKMSDRVHIDKSLHSTRNDFPFEVPSYEQMVKEMKAWVCDHQDLYPHYF